MSTDSTPSIAKELQVVRYDEKQRKVYIRSTANSLDDKRQQLDSEDAKTLAILEAGKYGVSGSGIKYSAIVYGDAENCIPATSFTPGEKADPFLVVEVYSPEIAATRIIGDSQLYSGKGF